MSFIRGDLIPFKFSFIFSPKSHLRLGHSPSLDAFLRPRKDTSRQATPETMAVSTADKSKPYIPLAGLARDGWSKDGKASATCYCGAVQLAFVSQTLHHNPAYPSLIRYCAPVNSHLKATASSTHSSATAPTAAKSQRPCSQATSPSKTHTSSTCAEGIVSRPIASRRRCARARP